MSPDPIEKQISEGMQRRNWLLLIGLSLSSLVFWDWPLTGGVIAGGLLSIVNFSLLKRVLTRQFRPGGRPSMSGILIRYYLRFAATAVIVFLLMKFRLVNGLGLLIGFSVIVINLTMTGLMLFRRARLKEAH